MSKGTDAAGLIGSGIGAATSFTGIGGPIAALGAMAGIFGGGEGGGGFDPQAILNAALDRAMGQNTAYTNKAITQISGGLADTNAAYKEYLQRAITAAQTNAQTGLARSAQLRAPTINTGYNALDAWQKSLGLATPQGGTANLARNYELTNQLAPMLSGLNGKYSVEALGAAPQLSSFASQITPDQLNKYVQENTRYETQKNNKGQEFKHTIYTGAGATGGTRGVNWNAANVLNNPGVVNQIRNQLAQSNFDQASSTYNTNVGNIGKLNQLLQGVDINALAPLLRGKI